MVFPDNSNWFCDYNLVDGGLSVHNSVVPWPIEPINVSGSLSAEIDGFLDDLDGLKESGSRKRVKSESCIGSSSKAGREKQRRDQLNEKFMELRVILEAGRSPKVDKPAILMDAVRMVNQLRGEAQKLKDLNSSFQEKIKELKAEKNELRDEKQKLKTEKEKLEHQLKAMKAQPQPFCLQNLPTVPQVQAPVNKLVQFSGYPTFSMWQFMPSAAVDTSQDHVLRPPVA